MVDEVPDERALPGHAEDSLTLSDEVTVTPITADVSAAAALEATFTATAAGTATEPVVTWETAARGYIQAKLEEVVNLLTTSDLLVLLAGDDKITAEAIRDLLSDLLHVEGTPDKSVVAGPLRWLWRKVDTFLDAAAKSAGKAAGPALVGVALLHLPQLHHLLNELTTLAGQSGE
jgi:hypothetical protein